MDILEFKAVPPWVPNLQNFVFGTQGAFVPNFKSVDQIASEIRTMQYFSGHLGIEDSATPDAQNLIRLSSPRCTPMC